MRRQCVVTLVLAVGAAFGCSDRAVSTNRAPASANGRAATIRMEMPVAPDIPDLPRLIARDALRALGYAVESAAYGDNAIAIQAMITGDLDFARVPMVQALAAIQQGAAITMIVGGGDQTRILAGAPDVKTCSDLNDRQVSVPNLISAQTLTLRRYLATRCPEAKVELVVIAGVENRVAALISNRTGGALLEATNMFELQRVHGSKFNAISDFSIDYPNLNGAAVVAPRAFLEHYPVTARDIVREMLQAMRSVQDLGALTRALEKYLALNPADAENTARLYLTRKIWDVNGGLVDEGLRTNIDFFVEAGVLKPGLTPALTADRSYLNAVLDEIGRK